MISIGSDHGGFEIKEVILNWLTQNGIDDIDFGTDSMNSVDYPDYAHAVVASIIDEESKYGILICGTGNGICMTANKWRDIRSALCWNPEIAQLAKQHNNANVICLPGRYITGEQSIEIVKSFLTSEFEGGRHEKRVDKINPQF